MITQIRANPFLKSSSLFVIWIMFFFHVVDEGHEGTRMDSFCGVSSVAEFAV